MTRFEQLQSVDGLFVGQLTPDELALFQEAVTQGEAKRVYDGASGFLGLAKVCLVHPSSESPK